MVALKIEKKVKLLVGRFPSRVQSIGLGHRANKPVSWKIWTEDCGRWTDLSVNHGLLRRRTNEI